MRSILAVLGRRLATRHPGRTLLILLAIAVPVALTVAMSSIATTAQVTDEEARSARMGQADLYASRTTRDDIGAVLTPGSRAVTDQHYARMPVTSADGRGAESLGYALDLRDPLTEGMFVVRQGAIGDDPHGVALSTALARQLGVGVGGEVFISPSRTPYRVAALVVFPLSDDQPFFVVRDPIPVAGAQADRIVGPTYWLVSGSLRPDVPEGDFAVTYRGSVLSSEAMPVGPQLFAGALGVGVLAVSLLLITAAVAVVARDQTRTAGLLAALGVPSRRRWSFLTAYVRVLGLGGVLIGIGIGLAAAYVVQGPLQERAGADWGRFTPAWVSIVAIAVLTFAAVTVTCSGPRRAMSRRPLLELLSALPPAGRPLGAWGWVGGGALIVVGAALFVTGFMAPGWSSVSSLMGAVAVAAGLVLLLLVVLGRWARRPILPGSAAFGLTLRQLLASSSRAALAAVAIAAVAAFAAYLQMASAILVDQALRNRHQPVPAGTALVQTRRALTATELAALDVPVHTFAPAEWKADGANISVETDLMRCIADTTTLSPGGALQPHECLARSRAHTVVPQVAVATAADVDALAHPAWDRVARAAFDRGTSGVSVGPTGTGDRVQLVTWQPRNGRLVLTPRATVAVISTADTDTPGSLPAFYVSPAGARRVGLAGGDPQYLVGSENVAGVRARLPADVQGDAEFEVGEDSPFLAPARATNTVATLTSALVVAGIMAIVMALWSSDLRASRQMLAAVGAPLPWMRRAGGLLALVLSGSGLGVGTVAGVGAAVMFMTEAHLPWSWTWTPLISGAAGLLASVVIGAASVTRKARASRRA